MLQNASPSCGGRCLGRGVGGAELQHADDGLVEVAFVPVFKMLLLKKRKKTRKSNTVVLVTLKSFFFVVTFPAPLFHVVCMRGAGGVQRYDGFGRSVRGAERLRIDY